MKRRLVSTATILVILGAAAEGRAESYLMPRLALGGAAGSAGPGVETTFTLTPLGPHVSAGVSDLRGSQYVYGEVAGSLWLTLGIGAGRRFGAPGSPAAGHFFVGLPLPLVGFWDSPDGRLNAVPFGFIPGHGGPTPDVLYIEPYYRPQFLLGGSGGVIHEGGVMLKVAFSLSKDWR